MKIRLTSNKLFLLAAQLVLSVSAFAVEAQSGNAEAPSVVIYWPGIGAEISGDSQVGAAAMDNTGVSKVVFTVNGTWVGEDTTAPYTFNWDSSAHDDGPATIQATAHDLDGNTNSYAVDVVVNNQGSDDEAPNVIISSPGYGSTVSDNVQVTAHAMDNIGIAKVTFAVDGSWAGKDTAAPYTFDWDASTHAGGPVTIEVTAYDLAGNSSSYSMDVVVDKQQSQQNSLLSGSESGYQCFGCDDTNTKEKDTISKYDNADGLFKASNLWRIPWLEKDYIPQGIHVTEDEFIYMSMYHQDKDNASYNASIVIKYSATTNRVVDVYHLKNSNNSKYMGHVGGLVVNGDYIIVPNGNQLYYFRQSDAIPTYGIESEIKLAFTTSMDFGGSEYNFKMSFLSTAKDHQNRDILWTGQFSTSTTVASHVLGYKIEADGRVNPTPVYRFFVPETVNKLQGVTVLNASYGTYTLLLSRSYGNNTSYVYKLNYTRQESNPYKYDYSSKSIAFKGPAGLEDLHITADGVWSLSESGANYYQNRPSNPWSQLFPFVIKLRKADL